MTSPRASLTTTRRIVVKLGTNALTGATGKFQRAHFRKLAKEVLLAARGREVIIVSSGAIALGVERLGLPARPKDVPSKQACAAVGQSRLMHEWEEALAPRIVAQVLLTHSDMQSRRRYLNARHALDRLLEAGAIPVINENDTVSVDEIKFGDNDHLAALVASLIDADALVILSDVEGLYDKDPRVSKDAKLLTHVAVLTPEIMALAGGVGSSVGTGGMATKISAAAKATELGIHTLIISGATPGNLTKALIGEEVGTFFEGKGSTRDARSAWIAQALKPKGVLVVDAGARKALVEKKKSLLPSGVKSVEGDFLQGEAVDLREDGGGIFARGLAAYPAEEMRRIAGKKTAEIEKVLGYRGLDEAIHRDDLAVL